ncbi:hypothetical protein Q2941_25340 [Bradyrhizobium sp. UFLA05-153]
MTAADNLPTRLRNILSRQPQTDAEIEDFIDDLEKVIRGIEQVQIDASRERFRRRAASM